MTHAFILQDHMRFTTFFLPTKMISRLPSLPHLRFPPNLPLTSNSPFRPNPRKRPYPVGSTLSINQVSVMQFHQREKISPQVHPPTNSKTILFHRLLQHVRVCLSEIIFWCKVFAPVARKHV